MTCEGGAIRLLGDKRTALTQTGFTQGLVPIPKPIPIPAPKPLPTPAPIQGPMPMPRPSVLPGTATIDQYYLPKPAETAAVTGRVTRLTQEGTPAVGQYLPTPTEASATGQIPPAEQGRASVVTQLSHPGLAGRPARSPISLPAPERFWRRTAAARRVSIPTPEDYWRGMPTTSQISLPEPEHFWRR
jgi:hypothetical protein